MNLSSVEGGICAEKILIVFIVDDIDFVCSPVNFQSILICFRSPKFKIIH